MPEQDDYQLVRGPVTHKVEKDLTKTLVKLDGKIRQFKRELGPDALLVVTLSAHIPKRKVLGT